MAGLHFLQAVIAYGRGSAQCGFHVGFLQQATLLGGMSPYSGEAIGLQLQLHRQRI